MELGNGRGDEDIGVGHGFGGAVKLAILSSLLVIDLCQGV